MRTMDTRIHRDRPMKIEHTTSNDTSSLGAMLDNLGAISWIQRMRLKNVDSQIVI